MSFHRFDICLFHRHLFTELVFENELFDHGKYLQWQKVASIEKVKLEHFSFKVNKFYFCLLPGSH